MYTNHKKKGQINGNSAVMSLCLHKILSVQPSDPDLFCFAAISSLKDLAIFMAPQGQVASSTLGDHFEVVTWKLSGSQSRLSQSLYALQEFAAHLLGLHAPAKESRFGLCQLHLEFPRGLPSKYYLGPMLLNLIYNQSLLLSCLLVVAAASVSKFI